MPPTGRAARQARTLLERDGDQALAQDLLDAMAKNQADFTLTFRRLSDAALGPDHDPEVGHCSPIPPPMTNGRPAGGNGPAREPQDPAARQAAMRTVNPDFIPRNHLIEAVIEAAVNRDDFAPFEELLTCFRGRIRTSRPLPAMRRRPNRTSACCRRFAGRKSLTPHPPSGQALAPAAQKLRKGQSHPRQI